MELIAPPEALLRWTAAPRLIPSRYPTVGLLDRVAAPEDLEALFELEGWTNDRINTELGLLRTIPRAEWVTGRPMASVVMAAFCHPAPGGGRFSSEDRGAWYAARTIATAIAESVYRRTQELREVGSFETRVEMRVYLADFRGRFHDVRQHRRSGGRAWARLYDPDDYSAGQSLARSLLESGSNGVVYRSVRDPGGQCLACFRPVLVRNVRSGGHYEFRWDGTPEPRVRVLP
jgi:RES domain-containing protein